MHLYVPEVPVYVDIYVCMIYIYMYDYMIYLYYIYMYVYTYLCVYIYSFSFSGGLLNITLLSYSPTSQPTTALPPQSH